MKRTNISKIMGWVKDDDTSLVTLSHYKPGKEIKVLVRKKDVDDLNDLLGNLVFSEKRNETH